MTCVCAPPSLSAVALMTAPEDNWWYSPQCLLLFADQALQYCSDGNISPPGAMQTAIDEGRTGAIFALGLSQALGVETWIRLVDRRERAPDVRVMYVDNTGPKGSHRMNTLQVEVVTYTKHSAGGLADFLFKVKLEPSKKAYSSDTVVVGFIERGASSGEVQAAHTDLVERGAGGLCYVIGRRAESRFPVV